MSRPRTSGPIRPRRLAVALAVALCSSFAPAQADPPKDAPAAKTRDDVIGEIAEVVAAKVKGEGQSAVVITEFNNPNDKSKTSGAGIRVKFAEKLKALGIESKESASLSLTGKFRVSTGISGGVEIPAEQIDYVLATESGKELLNSSSRVGGVKPGVVKDLGSVTDSGSANVQVTPSKPAEANRKVIKEIDKDKKASAVVVEEGRKIRPEAGSKFAVEILKAKLTDRKNPPAKDQYKPAAITLHDGVAFVDLDQNDVYAVNITNEHDFDVAAALSVDGIDMFQFSDEKAKRSRFWIYRPGLTHPLFGWHRSGAHFDRFLVGEYSEAQAGKDAIDDQKLSQISVEFRAAWSDASKMPADEGGDPKGDKGLPKTGQGPDVEDANELVASFIGKFRARVTLRYNRAYPDVPK